MAGKPFVACVGPGYSLPNRKVAVQRSINLAMSQVEGAGEGVQAVLVSTDGLSERLELGATFRGALVTSDAREFVVAGATLYETTTGAAVSRGTLVSSSG